MGERVHGALGALLARRRELGAPVRADPALALRLRELRGLESTRLARTYEDLRRAPGARAAFDFLLAQGYGPAEFTQRDTDLERAARVLERTLPRGALAALCAALELDAVSRELDLATTRAVAHWPLHEASYAEAYRRVGRRADRLAQIQLLGIAGERLGDLVRQRWIGRMLRLARGPAEAAGFGALQDVLESGFDAFQQLGDGLPAFLTTLEHRECAYMERLFADSIGATTPTVGE